MWVILISLMRMGWCGFSLVSNPFAGLIAYTSKLSLSTLEFTLGCIVQSVEATIFMRVIRGSWPGDFCCEFAALTTDASGKNTASAYNAPCIDREKFVLLDSRGEGAACL